MGKARPQGPWLRDPGGGASGRLAAAHNHLHLDGCARPPPPGPATIGGFGRSGRGLELKIPSVLEEKPGISIAWLHAIRQQSVIDCILRYSGMNVHSGPSC